MKRKNKKRNWNRNKPKDIVEKRAKKRFRYEKNRIENDGEDYDEFGDEIE